MRGVIDHSRLRKVRLICSAEHDGLSVCHTDPQDALLKETLWWRAIAGGRLERLRQDALRDCYDSGGLFGRPSSCTGVKGRGWPEFRPVR